MFRQYTQRVFIAMSAQAFAQLNGINVISYYAPLVFEQAGWVGRDAILMTGINVCNPQYRQPFYIANLPMYIGDCLRIVDGPDVVPCRCLGTSAHPHVRSFDLRNFPHAHRILDVPRYSLHSDCGGDLRHSV